ncbi:hypothetical protein B0J11DRAFT_507208 [Dendryphion nanum]|uniref:Cytochrome P450 n=1 Tax=Dendryphion nanum TaxID=256645 RepID=A0A9P9DTB8_9PLEO|nr:hypothetical protein B0J11DRAFT_507208 [Dendryphion nanum]
MLASIPPHLPFGLIFALVVIYHLANHASRKRLPPSAPSIIPYYDHIRGFLEGGGRLYSIMIVHAGSRISIRFNLPGAKVFLITSPELIRTTLYDTKSFVAHHARTRFIKNALGYSTAAIRTIENDTSGSAREPLPGSSTPANKRILRMQQVTTLDVISSKDGMEEMLHQFTRVYDEMLKERVSGNAWVELHDLHGFMRHIGSTAIITALCGPRLLKKRQGFLDAFWTFEERVHFFHMALPNWLNPQIDEYCGSGANLGILWAFVSKHSSNDNIVPIISEYIFAMLRSAPLVVRYKAEMAQAHLPTDQPGSAAEFDPSNLIKQLLLQLLLNEVLRTKASSLIGRTAREDFQVGNHTVPKGSMALVLAHLEHMSQAVWEARSGARNLLDSLISKMPRGLLISINPFVFTGR